MNKLIYCHKLKKELEPLNKPPFPGELGQRILKEISKQAWQSWMNHQTMLINEYRLSMIDPKSRQFIKEEMMKFLFEGGAEKPEGYVPEDNQ